jgi:filamentous hemagglutinin family protein
MRVLNVGGVDAAMDDIHHHRFKLATVVALCLLSFGAQANPTGGNVVNGSATFNASGNTLTVTNTPGTIINWQDFSIQQNEITRFNQQSASSAVLNRVVGGNTSQILGSLQSNGRVFLVNPNGVVFGAGSTVDVAGLVATSLNLSDADFLAGRHRFSSDPNAQAVSNAGNINAQQGGEIWLIAPNVENSGVITAPDGEILLAAGSSVELVNSLDPNLRVNITAPAGDATNVGQLVASAGRLGLFGTIVRNSGLVSADSATMQGGKIVFKSSQRTEITGSASATGVGGGRIDVLSDMTQGTVQVSGTLDASAPVSGDGGFIDTSAARVNVLDGARISTLAAGGRNGNWLIDPTDFTISATDPANGSSWMSNATLATSLGAGDVTIQTLSTGAANGDIFVNGAVSWANSGVGTTLTLLAHNDIENNAAITGTCFSACGSNLFMDAAGSIINNGTISANGMVTLYAGNAIIANTGGGVTDVTASSLILQAANGIASTGVIFKADVTGAINFNNTASNAVNIYNKSVAGAGRTISGSNTNGSVRIDSFDSTNATTISSLSAGGDILLRMDNLVIGGAINAGANTVYLSPYTISPTVNPISIGGTDAFNLTGAGISLITAGTIVVGKDSTFGNYASAANIATAAAVSITNSANLEVWTSGIITTGTPGFSYTGGSVRLVSDSMSIGGAINVGSGQVNLEPYSSAQNVDVGGVDGTGVLGLSASELGFITAGTLLVGDPLKTGSLTVSSSIAPANVTILGLGAGGAITQSAGAGITANELVIDSGSYVELNDPSNAVGNLAAISSGDFRFYSSTALNLVANNVEGINGVTSAAGMIALTSAGALTQSAGATLTSTSAYVEGSKVVLNEANPVGVIAGKATGSVAGDIFSYTSSNAILVDTVNGFAGIQAVADSVVLNAGSAGISQYFAPINASAGLSLNTTGSVNLTYVSNNIGALTATGISSLALYGASTVDVVTSVPTFTISDQLTVWGDLNITNNGGSIAVNSAQVTSYGIATFTATGSLKIDATSADSYIMGAPDVDLFLGGDMTFVTSAGFNAYVSSQMPASTHLTFNNATGKVFFNGIQAEATTSGNTGFFFGGDPVQGGTPAVLATNLILVGGDPNNFIPITAPTTPTTTTTATPVVPTLAECLADSSVAGCSEVLLTATQDITQTLPVANTPAGEAKEDEKKKEEEQLLAEADIGNDQGSGLPDNLPVCR